MLWGVVGDLLCHSWLMSVVASPSTEHMAMATEQAAPLQGKRLADEKKSNARTDAHSHEPETTTDSHLLWRQAKELAPRLPGQKATTRTAATHEAALLDETRTLTRGAPALPHLQRVAGKGKATID